MTTELKPGDSYTVTRSTPLMPELDPADPLAALERLAYIPQGGSFKVKNVRVKGGFLWYFVEAYKPDGAAIGTGWINSIALISATSGGLRQ